MAKGDVYHPDYNKLYPKVAISPEVRKFLKHSDRKMEYMEIDLKRGTFRQNGAYFTQAKEVSLDSVVEEDEPVFVSTDTSPEERLIANEEIDRLHRALEKLLPEERDLIRELYFKCTPETLLAQRLGITQQAISKRLMKIVRKLRQML